MIAVGVGCRTGCASDDVVVLVREALARLRRDQVPGGLFTIAARSQEPGLVAAARTLGLPLTGLDATLLRLVAGNARSCSRRIEETFGLPGIAETAALAGAGQGAVLLVARLASATATCAVAGAAEP